jgi:ABC-type transport system substrate-binding protein
MQQLSPVNNMIEDANSLRSETGGNDMPRVIMKIRGLEFVGIATCVCAILALTLTAAPTAIFAGEQKYGGSIGVGVESDFPGFDALKAGSLSMSSSSAMNVICERLFNMDDDGNLKPVLGISAMPSDDRKTWTIKLRKGVTFHDGTPFNADAVVHHWKRIFAPESRISYLRLLRPIRSVDKIDDFTVRFSLKHPWPPIAATLSSIGSMAAYIPSPRAVDEGTHNWSPVGTGPFVFKEWESGNRFVVERNPNYWQKGKPYLDKIVFRPLPDPHTGFASLKSGQVHVMWTDRGNLIRKAMKDNSLVTYQSEDAGAMVLLLNCSRPPLDDVRVRRALAHAWNQELFVKMSAKDTIPVVYDPFGKTCKCDDVCYRHYEIKKAKQLLAAYGKPVEVRVDHTTTPRGVEIAVIAQQFFKKVGVTVKPVPTDYLTIRTKIIEKTYQIAGWYMRPGRDLGPLFFAIFFSESPINLACYDNPEMDRLLLAQRIETDPEKRKSLLCAIARLLNKDAPIIYCGGRHSYVFARPEVKGITSILGGIPRLSDVWLDK